MISTVDEGKLARACKTQQFATFRVAGMFLGIELFRVQELMRAQDMASVPLAPSAVEGLINLRGQIVTALNIRRIFGLAEIERSGDQPMNIIVDTDDGTVSLLVDEICDVLEVPIASLTQLPENLSMEQRKLLKAVFQLEDGLLLVLDTQRVISSDSD